MGGSGNDKILESLKQCDVLMLCPDSDWWLRRCSLRVSLLTDAGYSISLVQVRDNRYSSLSELVEATRPQIVLIHALSAGADSIRRIARERPDVKFMVVNHSSHAHLPKNIGWMKANAMFVENTLELANHYYASPDERNQFRLIHDCDRFQWTPNAVQIPDEFSCARPAADAILIAGRYDIVKNLPNQYLAAGILNKVDGMRILSVINQHTGAGGLDYLKTAYCQAVERQPWMNWSGFMEFLRTRVSLTFQASFTESFNFLALESMMCGRPVVGSPAIRYLPKDWQANPDDAESIVRVARRIMADYGRHARTAREVSVSFAGQMNQSYLAWFRRLIDR